MPDHCEICGRNSCKLDAHHIEGRGTILLRYSIENGICLCVRCHRNGVHSTSSSVQAEYRSKLIKIRGQEVMDRLSTYRYITKKYYNEELETIEQALKEAQKERSQNVYFQF